MVSEAGLEPAGPAISTQYVCQFHHKLKIRSGVAKRFAICIPNPVATRQYPPPVVFLMVLAKVGERTTSRRPGL